MNGIEFTKMHGLGNDFVVIDATGVPFDLGTAAIRRLADRRFGVGCDQVLVIEPGRDGCDFGYRVFNADGGEVGHCGNGVRCIARRVRDLGLSAAEQISFSIGGRRVETRLLDDGRVAVDMGVPAFAPAAIPLRRNADDEVHVLDLGDQSVEIGAVSLGNPHAVRFVDDVAAAPVRTLGPRIEGHPDFPERANAGFAQVVGRDRIRLRVWERGAGETLACGTGACAAVAVGRRRGLLDDRVTVELPGGALVIDWAGTDNDLWMTGPAETVFHGHLITQQ